jgi:hypothetical protein
MATEDGFPELLTVEEAHERIGGLVSKRTLYRLARELPGLAVRVKGKLLFFANQLTSILTPVVPPPAAPPTDPPAQAKPARGKPPPRGSKFFPRKPRQSG